MRPAARGEIRYPRNQEITDLALPLATAGHPHVSRLRGYGRAVKAGLEELVAIGRG